MRKLQPSKCAKSQGVHMDGRIQKKQALPGVLGSDPDFHSKRPMIWERHFWGRGLSVFIPFKWGVIRRSPVLSVYGHFPFFFGWGKGRNDRGGRKPTQKQVSRPQGHH